MTTPLPEPTYYLASNGRLMQTDGDIDCTGKRLAIYTADQMRAYGAAEYQRALSEANVSRFADWMGEAVDEAMKEHS